MLTVWLGLLLGQKCTTYEHMAELRGGRGRRGVYRELWPQNGVQMPLSPELNPIKYIIPTASGSLGSYSLQNCNLSVALVRLKVREAIEEVEKLTPLIFQEDPQATKDVLIFGIEDAEGCSECFTYEGWFRDYQWQNKYNLINIGGCWDSVGSIVHELGHKIGLGHELFYDSVDDYVKINATKIDSDLRPQILTTNTWYKTFGKFDPCSIMAYSLNPKLTGPV